MSGTKYAMLGSGILLWFTTACSVSSPVKKLSVPLPCYNEIQLTKEGWEEDRLSGYYRIDRTKLPNVEMIGMCFKNLDPDAFQSVFGAASTREKYKGSSKLWYNVFGEADRPVRLLHTNNDPDIGGHRSGCYTNDRCAICFRCDPTCWRNTHDIR